MAGGDERRLLETLEQLLAIPAVDLRTALARATDLVAAALRADKVDAFLYDPDRDSMVALGSSNQPLSAEQRRHGLDVLPVANGGRVMQVFATGRVHLDGHADRDPEELRGIRETLGVRSQLGVALEVGGQRRGVLMIASQKPELFTAGDAQFAESVARWIGAVAHRAELAEQVAVSAAEQGRRAGAEELVTVLAHDFRNYLAPLDARLGLLLRRAQREQRGSDQEDIEAARKALARLAGLITDILDVSRLDRGVLDAQVQPVDLVKLLRDAALALATPDQPVDVDAAEPLSVEADPARVRQCIDNLIANAVKHSPRGAAVTVRARRARRHDRDCARIDVIDQGPGVPADVLPLIFDRFVTAERRGHAGLGLGLYLAKQIAAMHGGDLTVDSTAGRATCFTLFLPCCIEQP